jgi:hypothetical protein
VRRTLLLFLLPIGGLQQPVVVEAPTQPIYWRIRLTTDDRPGTGPAELRALLATHQQLLAADDHNEYLDVDFALSLHRKLEAVLDRWDSYDAARHDRITRTVRYVVDTDDEEHDLRSPIGVVDDGEQVDDLLTAIAPDLLS